MESKTERSFYSNNVHTFINQESSNIEGEIHTKAISISPNTEQSNAWKEQIEILKDQLKEYSDSRLIFEYVIPRVGKRVDNVILLKNIVFVLEFKCYSEEYPKHASDQVCDYALDLKFFHKESENRLIVPIIVCTDAEDRSNSIILGENRILEPLYCNRYNIGKTIEQVIESYPNEPFLDTEKWINSDYCPVPTIIEAARSLYANHSVKDITRHDGNIDVTTEELDRIINYSKMNRRKSICFVTGVPGAGKTLVGLDLAIKYSDLSRQINASYLSGNGPLVKVLSEALIRDKVDRETNLGNKYTKAQARMAVQKFIWNIHNFRDDLLDIEKIPHEHVVIFDESQRAWTKEKICKFMKTKKGVSNFNQSEPEFLISTMNRHRDWATIVCLVGGGQEIYEGEAGLPEWFDSLKRSFRNWDVYVAPELNDSEYCRDREWNEIKSGLNVIEREQLHLPTSIRSFRTADLSTFIKHLLDLDKDNSQHYLKRMKDKYPIYLTRDIDKARQWVKSVSRGTTRYGILASSKAMRLKPSGLFIQSSNDIVNWILGDKDDVRSSYFLEEPVTEFDIQGLEIDYTIVAWDADLRMNDGNWEYHDFKGNHWVTIHNKNNKLYLKNAYRVLLTRARQGMIIFVPEGNDEDETRLCSYYDQTYNYLHEIGIKDVDRDFYTYSLKNETCIAAAMTDALPPADRQSPM